MNSTLVNFGKFYSCLKGLSFDNLPGVEAQWKMAPSIRESDMRKMGAGRSPNLSAVMLFFYPSPNLKASLILIKRTESGGAHSGQISFPGGRFENTDLSLEETALRETHEEIGVSANVMEMAGKLTDLYIPPSNFIVSPFVSISQKKPVFRPHPKEVAKLVEVELEELINPDNRRMEKIRLQEGFMLETPCFFINGHIVWGATAMILNEFLEYFNNSTGC